MKKSMTCIICPRGCSLSVDSTPEGLKVAGNSCPKGEKYAISECTNPVRTVTSIVRISNRKDTMASVKTSCPIPKGKMLDAMEQIRRISVPAPVHIGDVVKTDVFGADILITKEIL